MAHFLEESSPFDAVSALVARSAKSCRFTFFKTEQAERLSVCRITRPEAYDDLGKPIINGVHDARLGVTQSIGQVSICPTCQLTPAQGCLGHLGHVKLHSQVYNPYLMQSLGVLLQLICGHCGRFRINAKETANFARRFDCLARGVMPPEEYSINTNEVCYLEKDVDQGWDEDKKDASLDILIEDHIDETRTMTRLPHRSAAEHKQVAARLGKRCSRGAKRKLEESSKEMDEILRTFPALRETEVFPSFLNEQWRKAIKDFTTKSKKCRKCQNCGKKAMKFKKDGNTRIFILDAKDKEKRFFCTPTKIREYVKQVWEMEKDIIKHLYPGTSDAADQLFFVETILVTPNNFRPLAGGPGSTILASETRNLVRILECNQKLTECLKAPEDKENKLEVEGKKNQAQHSKYVESIAQTYVNLQEAVNIYYDSSMGTTKADREMRGIRQVLERKEGLFRNKMMGKRVNFAARSVISPDNNLEGNEIGIPPHIAMALAYPEAVTPYNAAKMRQLVEAGAEEYPGASFLLELGSSGQNRCIDLKFLKKNQRQALAKKLIVGLESGDLPFVVYRHLVNGDPVLMNRQPTLHKPGIMAHKVRVLQGEKTIRMHYVNCNTYNADFDGDEMNVHAPQDPISRIEALSIALTDYQYLVPTSGKPLRGLIQDHVIGGVFLCARDTLLTQEEAAHLLYKGLLGVIEGQNPKHFVEVPSLDKEDPEATVLRPMSNPEKQFRFIWDEPCIMKPKRWSGKQIMSMVLKTLLRVYGWTDCKLLHTGKAKTPGDIWGGAYDGNKEEEQVIIRGTELLCGVLDKSQFGSVENGLVHLCYEIFGPAVASRALSVFAKLFTTHLQHTGFTCAMSDFLVDRPSDKIRAGLIQDTHAAGKDIIDQFADEQFAELSGDKEQMDHITWKLKSILAKNPSKVDLLDAKMLGKLRELWGKTIDVCLPAGQLVPFPKNCFSAMINTGAKGSKINHSQISCLMGQQELEGRRVPFCATRRSLPCFAPFDYGPRAGGYITDRFLTGIRPQEYFFHCMAGREGLVDTAVKTSRSGYLQRCLVKHLETLVVGYDYTVRDISDNSVVQFLYGEDGVDVMNAPYLMKYDVIESNPMKSIDTTLAELEKSNADTSGLTVRYRDLCVAALNGLKPKKVLKKLKTIQKECEENYPDEAAHLYQIYGQLAMDYDLGPERWLGSIKSFMDPVESIFSPGSFFGSTSEKFDSSLRKYLKKKDSADEEKTSFHKRMHLRYQKALAVPGEAVGVIAAQSMGEPSTQMTLNTFHLAGHGGANVTLGIPRLREIVQTASRKITTPYMKVFFNQTPAGVTNFAAVRQYAVDVAKRYSKTLLKDLVKENRVTEVLRDLRGERVRTYTVQIEFEDLDIIAAKLPYITKKALENKLMISKESFMYRLGREVKKIIQLAEASSEQGIQKAGISKGKAAEDVANVKISKKLEEKEEGAADEEGADDDQPKEPPLKKRKISRRAAVQSDDESGNSDNDSDGTDAESNDDQEDALKRTMDLVEQNECDSLIKLDDNEDGPLPIGNQDPAHMQLVEGEADDEDDVELPSCGNYLHEPKFERNTFTLPVTISIKDSRSKILIAEVVTSLLNSISLQDPIAKNLHSLHTRDENKKVFIETEGINMEAFWALPRGCIDIESIYTNDIGMILEKYGVEACRQSIVNEIRNVFSHYGIEVNYRHLFLISDYMTHQGGYRACNRQGMEHAASPLLQMSYETSMKFCTSAAVEGLTDNLQSPTGSIVIGSAPQLGSNSFTVHTEIPRQQATKKKVFAAFH